MKKTVFSRIISFIILMAFSGCSTAPAVNIVPVQTTRALLQHMQQTTTRSQTGRTQAQPQQAATAQSASPYWTGDGGRGRSITILPPRGSGLTENQSYLPDLVANELVSNFSSFSAMALFDRVNNQRQYDELLSGYYSDTDQAGLDLGHLASTDYMLLGDITRTSTGYVLQLTVVRNSNKTTAASHSGTVSIIELDNLTGVRRASLDLLQKMGVQLTARAQTELTRAATNDHVNAMTALAQGINAQRQGTEVAALTYFFQAAAFDASLVEAVSRTNVLSTNISTGNIGANVRNDIAWRSDWVAKLAETETLMNNMLRSTSPQRSIWYTTNIVEREAARDYTRETTELSIEAALHTHAVFPVSVQRTVQAVYDGLQTTGRTQAWGLNNWPRNGVTNSNPFNNRWGSMISIAFELLNEQNQVIGRQTVEKDSRFSFNGTRLEGPGTVFTTVRFTGVNAHAISDQLNIRIASINGRPPEQAGISRIEPMSAQRMQADRTFTIYNGAIRPSSNDRNLGTVTIPAELWGERVTAMVFENRGLTSVTIPQGIVAINDNAFANNRLTSVIIPEGVTTIGDRAFAGNHWTTTGRRSDGSSYTNHHGLRRITIPNSVTSIGQEAFFGHWTYTQRYSDGSSAIIHNWLILELAIGANVSLERNAIGAGFEVFYANQDRQAGFYTRTNTPRWERFDSMEAMRQTENLRNKRWRGFEIVLGVLIVGGIILLAVLLEPQSD